METADALVGPYTLNGAGQSWVIETIGYGGLFLQFAGTATMSVAYEASADGTNWVGVAGASSGPGSTGTTDAPAGAINAFRAFPMLGRYFRVRVTAYTSGSIVFRGVLKETASLPYVSAWIQGATPNLAIEMRQTAGGQGGTTTAVRSTASTMATLVKNSAGNLFDIDLFNGGAGIAYLKLFNLTVAPTVGTSVPFLIVPLPAGQRTRLAPNAPFRFGTGISYSITGGIADADVTAVAADQVVGALNWA